MEMTTGARCRAAVAALVVSLFLSFPGFARAASSVAPGFVVPYSGYAYPPCDGSHTCMSSVGDYAAYAGGYREGEPQVSPDGKFVYVVSAFGRIDWYPTSAAGYLETDAVGCVGTNGCATAVRGVNVTQIVIAPDGHTVYGVGGEGIATFARDASTGALTQLASADGCLIESAVAGCGIARGIYFATDLVIAPDGSALYVIGSGGPDIASFAIGAAGVLAQPAGTAGCIAASGAASGDGCATAADPSFAPDTLLTVGHSLYVRSTSATDSTFDLLRAGAAPGELAQQAAPAGCFNRTGDGGCTAVRGPAFATLQASADGSRLSLSTSNGSFGVVTRDPSTGAVTQAAGASGCVAAGGADGCAPLVSSTDSGAVVPLADGSVLVPASPGPAAVTNWQRYQLSPAGFVDGGTVACPVGCWSEGDATVSWSPTIPELGYVRSYVTSVVVVQRETWPTCHTDTAGPFDHTSPITLSLLCRASTGETPALLSWTATTGSFDSAGTYLPGAIGSGPVTLTVQAGGVTTTFAFSIVVADNAPYCPYLESPTYVAVVGRTGVGVSFSCIDADGDRRSLSLSTPPRHGAVSFARVDQTTASGTVEYTPNAGFSGSDQFSVVATDRWGGVSSPVEVDVTVYAPIVVTFGAPTASGRKLDREGTYHGLLGYFSWLGAPDDFTASAQGHWLGDVVSTSTAMNTGVATTLATMPSEGGGVTSETYDWMATLPTSSVVNISCTCLPDAGGFAVAPWSAGIAVRLAMPIRLRGSVKGRSIHITSTFGRVRDHAGTRGTALLMRRVHGRWRKVSRIKINSRGVGKVTVPVNGAIYAIQYIPKDSVDLDPSYYAFKAAVARSLASADWAMTARRGLL
jgi:hypothetical protein